MEFSLALHLQCWSENATKTECLQDSGQWHSLVCDNNSVSGYWQHNRERWWKRKRDQMTVRYGISFTASIFRGLSLSVHHARQGNLSTVCTWSFSAIYTSCVENERNQHWHTYTIVTRMRRKTSTHCYGWYIITDKDRQKIGSCGSPHVILMFIHEEEFFFIKSWVCKVPRKAFTSHKDVGNMNGIFSGWLDIYTKCRGEIRTDRPADRQKDGRTDRWTDRQTGRQICRKTDR